MGTIAPVDDDGNGELNDEADPGTDDDDGNGSLTGGNDAGGTSAPPVIVRVPLIADLDYDMVLPGPIKEQQFSVILGNVLLAAGITVLAPTTFERGSIIMQVSVADTDALVVKDTFTNCALCFTWNSNEICPRPANSLPCGKSGFTSVEQTQQEQDASKAAADKKKKQTTSAVVPVIFILLLIAFAVAFVTAKRRVAEAKDREDEMEVSELTKVSGRASNTNMRKSTTRNMINSVIDMPKEDTYGEAVGAAVVLEEDAQYAEAAPASPELRPASMALSNDSASIRLVSTRRQNPMYAAAGAGAVSEEPVYAEGASGLVAGDYDAANNNVNNKYEYESGVPLYEAAGAVEVSSNASSLLPAAVLYEVADQEQLQQQQITYDVAGATDRASEDASVEAAYDVGAAAETAYDAAAPEAMYDAAITSAAPIPTGPVLYAVADSGDAEGGLDHIPGQPLRRSNSYGNALDNVPDSPPAPAPAPAAGEGPYI